MRVMLDTNILISAIYRPQSIPAQAYRKASSPDNDLILCDQILDELRRIFNRKFPTYIPQLERFLSILQYELVQTEETTISEPMELKIRDVKDRPIYRAAVKAHVDYFVTGDNDFLVSGITNPKIVTAQQYINLQ